MTEKTIAPKAVNSPACAILLAAGAGTRARNGIDGNQEAKQFQRLAGKPLLAWSLETLASHPGIGTVVLVLPHGQATTDEWNAYVPPQTELIGCEGGSSRRQSTLNGLQAWKRSPNYTASAAILVHDGARPCVTLHLIDALLHSLKQSVAAIPALPVTDTLKAENKGVLTSGPDRAALRAVQTPQAFIGHVLDDAHRKADAQAGGIEFTDDASIVEWAGQTCHGVVGDIRNIKITTPDDWARAEAYIMADKQEHAGSPLEPRVGLGYDVHRLVPGDGVWLCGHFIAHTHKLNGHSDADVGLHALTDALLGAIGAGDIGTHFPPSDPQWKGAASHLFLAHAAELISERGAKIINVDVAIVAEQPKVGPHRQAMTQRMADILGIAPSRVSVKATTNERMGFAGREEGIAAFATASVMVPADA